MNHTPKHTPTPWFSEDTAIYQKQQVFYIAETYFQNKTYVKHHSEAVANAAHIVKAVNLHDELIALLERITDVGYGFDEHDKAKDLLTRAKATL